MPSIKHAALAAAFALFLVTASQAPASAPAAVQGDTPATAALIQDRCTSCHSTMFICMNLGVQDADWWDTKVALMVQRGAKVSPEQVKEIAGYLKTLPEMAPAICE